MEKKWFSSWPENVPRTLVFPEKTLPEFLSDHARQTPEKVAFNFYGREVTFREFDRRTRQLARALMDSGLKKPRRPGGRCQSDSRGSLAPRRRP